MTHAAVSHARSEVVVEDTGDPSPEAMFSFATTRAGRKWAATKRLMGKKFGGELL